MANIIKKNNENMPATFNSLVDRFFNNSLSRFFDDDSWGFNGLSFRNQVPVNVRETEKTYEMELAAPGLRKEDFNVQVTNNMLTISYEHKEENREEKEDKGYMCNEYRVESFARSFGLDDTVDPNGISAKYSDGILHVTLLKKEGAQKITKSIKVK